MITKFLIEINYGNDSNRVFLSQIETPKLQTTPPYARCFRSSLFEMAELSAILYRYRFNHSRLK